MSPFFSIVIPTYNRALLVVGAINSVLAQTFQDFEIIVVDDGSTDQTMQAVRNIQDTRIHYFRKENEERSIARNFGINKALGRYIGFLDADDFLYPNHLKTAYDLIKAKHEPELLHLAYELRNTKGYLIKRYKFAGNINKTLAFSNELSCNGVIIRNDVVSEFQFISDRRVVVSEDWYLWLKLGARFKIHYSNEVTSVVNQHAKRSLLNTDPFKFEQSIKLIVENLDSDEQVVRFYGSGYRYFKAESFSMVALYHSELGNNKRIAFRYLVRSVIVYPRLVSRKRFWAIVRNLILR